MTREQWLLSAIDNVRPAFEAVGAPLPSLRVSVGWPKGARSAIGQCWAAEAVDDQTPAIFISPVLVEAPLVLKTLIHELVHATGRHGHGSEFGALAGQVGLIRPWKSSTWGDDLKVRLHALAEELGPFDHAGINAGARRAKTQTTRMLKAECSDDGYTVRLTRKWIDAMGMPSCPCGEAMVPA